MAYMNEVFTIESRRLHSLIMILVGGVFLFAGLDSRFFHMLVGSANGVWWGWIAVAGLGGAVLAAGIKTIINPVTLLTADVKGITVYSGVSASKWNSKTRSVERSRRRGDACLIPWNMISDIKEGTIETPVNPQTGKPKGLTLGGTITGHGSKKRHVARTLDILCDASVKLDGFETTGFSIARNGYQEGDLVGMSKAEREGLKPEDFLSCFILGSTGMNVRTAVAIDTLKRMQSQLSALR